MSDKVDPHLETFVQRVRSQGLVRRLLELAHDEDLCPNSEEPRDLTGESMFADSDTMKVRISARASCAVSGLAFVPDILDVFVHEHERVTWTPLMHDSDRVQAMDALGTLDGSARAIVRLERPLLNLLSRLSGIATRTAQFVSLAANPDIQICDTRKTTPGLRVFEKYAVLCGGGASHRMGLHDALLIKDNHLHGLDEQRFRAQIVAASEHARSRGASFVQVEVDTLDQLGWVLSMQPGVVDMVLLDNMDPAMLQRAIAMRDDASSSIKLEASGGVSEMTIAEIASTGIDRVSIGALTHQAQSVDFGLDA